AGLAAEISDSYLQRIQNPGRGAGPRKARRGSRQRPQLYIAYQECETRSRNAAAQESEILERPVQRALWLGHDGQGQRRKCVRGCAVCRQEVAPNLRSLSSWARASARVERPLTCLHYLCGCQAFSRSATCTVKMPYRVRCSAER